MEEFENKENCISLSNKPPSRHLDINDVPVGQKSAFFLDEYPDGKGILNFVIP